VRQTDEPNSGSVTRVLSYHKTDEEDTEVPRDEAIKA
jgi:hypothetical protein